MEENSKVTDTNVGDIEENIEELKRLLYRDELTQYGKRKLINYYEQQEKDYKRVLKDIAFNIMDLDFELIEDEIDIDNMKEMELDVIDDVTYYINDLIKAVKQIDKRVKRLEEK